jgi:tetratricopeptide (TPR) repeat protein
LDNLTELLRASLAQSPQINLLTQSHVGDTLQQMTKSPDTPITEPIAREIAMRNGAVRVIFARVSGSGGSYSVRIDIQQPANDPSGYRNHWPKSFFWHNSTASSSTVSPELSTCIRNAADWIRSETGESKSDIALLDAPPEAVTTGSWEALSEFNLAQKRDLLFMKDAAIAELQEAIRLDPDFALAYAKLGGILVSMERYSEGYTAYNMALQKDAGHRLSRRERDLIAGDYASDTRDFQNAVASYRDAATFYPKDVEVWTSQVYPLDLLDRPQEALSALAQAESLSPNAHPAAGGMAYTEMQIGNYAEARRWIEIVHETGREDYSILLGGFDDFLSGDFTSAQNAFERLKGSADPHFRRDGFACAARLEAEEGQFQQALDTLNRPERINSKDNSGSDESTRLLDEAYLFGKLKQYDRLLDATDEALKPGSSPDTVTLASDIVGRFLADMPQSARQRGVTLLGRMQQLVDPAQDSPVFSIARWRVRGELELASGKAANAVQSFRRADVLDAELAPRAYLARALLAEAVSTENSAQADSLRREALAMLARVANRPVIIWRRPMDFPLGSVGDAMQDYSDLAKQLNEASPEVFVIKGALWRLRPERNTGPPGHSQT